MAYLASVYATNRALRASATSCTALYAEDMPDVALDLLDSGEVDLNYPYGQVVALCPSTAGGLTCLPFPEGLETVASCRR